VHLVVFDLDGTLIDSRQDLADAANALIVERGGSPLSVDAIASMVGEGAGVLVRRALVAAGLPDANGAALPRFLELYDDRLLATTRLYDGIADTLDELARETALAVLTNKPARPTQRILDALGIADRFRWIVGGDGPLGRKPDPAGLRGLVTSAGVTPDTTVMVGDSPVDLATARAAATRICIATYGFGYRPAETDLRAGEIAIDRARDLVPALRRAFPSLPVRPTEN
jgi:phosphoglycolate phosphatase